jgi:hypothetical protein
LDGLSTISGFAANSKGVPREKRPNGGAGDRIVVHDKYSGLQLWIPNPITGDPNGWEPSVAGSLYSGSGLVCTIQDFPEFNSHYLLLNKDPANLMGRLGKPMGRPSKVCHDVILAKSIK